MTPPSLTRHECAGSGCRYEAAKVAAAKAVAWRTYLDDGEVSRTGTRRAADYEYGAKVRPSAERGSRARKWPKGARRRLRRADCSPRLVGRLRLLEDHGAERLGEGSAALALAAFRRRPSSRRPGPLRDDIDSRRASAASATLRRPRTRAQEIRGNPASSRGDRALAIRQSAPSEKALKASLDALFQDPRAARAYQRRGRLRGEGRRLFRAGAPTTRLRAAQTLTAVQLPERVREVGRRPPLAPPPLPRRRRRGSFRGPSVPRRAPYARDRGSEPTLPSRPWKTSTRRTSPDGPKRCAYAALSAPQERFHS
jgi:hypothetical protein